MVKKNRILVFILLVLFSAGLSMSAFAQGLSDMRLRVNAGISYEPVKKLELTARYRLTTYQGATVFLRSMFSMNASYKILKNWDAGGEYRYNTSYANDFHRFFLFMRVKYSIDKFDLSYRLRYQQDQDYFNGEYLSRFPAEKVFRNRLMVKYAYSKKIDIYTYADHFSEMKAGLISPYRVRYGAGIQYLHKKRHDVSLEFFVNDGFNTNSPENTGAIDVGYIYHLKKGKKKKQDQK